MSMQDVEIEIVRKLQEAKRAGDAALVAKIESLLADFQKQFADDLCKPASTQ